MTRGSGILVGATECIKKLTIGSGHGLSDSACYKEPFLGAAADELA
jgi:hypothetical protein